MIFETSTTMSPITYFGFDVCNMKLVASKRRLSIVPSLHNLNFTTCSVSIMSENIIFEKMSANLFWQVPSYVKECAEFDFKVCIAWNLPTLGIYFYNCYFFRFSFLGVGAIRLQPFNHLGTPSCPSEAPEEHIALVQRFAKASDGETAVSNSLPSGCTTFYSTYCGVSWTSTPTHAELSDTFDKCCVNGGHAEKTCSSIAAEVFDKIMAKAESSNDLAMSHLL